jgi:hypothetical protein
MKTAAKGLVGVSVALLAVLTFLAYGCGTTSHHRIVQPIQGDMKKYVILEITDMENFVPQTFNPEMCCTLKDYLVESAQKMERFEQVSSVSSFEKDPSTANVLVFKPTIVGYEPGSGVKRYFVGFGAGKAVLQMKLDMYDKCTGQHLGACILTSEAMMAGTNVYRPMWQQMVAFIDRYL